MFASDTGWAGTRSILSDFDGTAIAGGDSQSGQSQVSTPVYDQCIYALDATAASALYINGAIVINAPSCGVVVDSSSSTALKFSGSGTFTAKYFDVVGGYSASGAAKFSPTPSTGSASQADPLTFLVPPTSSACSFTNFKVTTGSSTLNPGTYCNGITVSGATNVTFNPGTYILMGGGLNVTGASILKGSGVTFFLTQGLGYSYGPMSISSSVVATLSAPTSGPYYGILVYQDRGIGTGKAANAVTGASTSSLNGVLYFPTTALTLAGAEAGGNCLIIVADTITLTGAAAIGNGCSGGSPLQPPVTVSVTPATATLYGGQTQQFTASVTNTSNTAVTWTISPTGTGTINSSGQYTAPATISTQQTVTVTATSQASSTASASSTVTLMPKASQTISFTAASPVTYPVSPITLSATASSGLAVTFSVLSGPGTVNGSTLTITGVGTVVVAANQAGNTYYAAAPQVTQSIVVNYSTPIANAGPPQTVYLGTTVQLDGTGSSDPAGLPLTYSWSFVSVPSGSTAALSSTTAPKPTFVADKVGTYKVQLIVNNGHNSSTPSTVTITSQNQPPVANAGPPQTVYEEATVQLNGTGSYDPAGLPITYLWSFSSLPSGSKATLTGATTPMPTFVADKVGTYIVQLVVNNGVFSSTPSTVTITTLNSPPVANAGPNQTVTVQSTVQLNGSGSTDVDGDPLTYTWSFVSVPAGSKAALSNPSIVNPTFVADVVGSYVVQLVVNDGFSNSTPSTVTISTIDSPPVANAGPNQSITVTGTVQLNGSGSTDVDGNALTYSWSFLTLPQGSHATLSNSNAVKPTFVADVLGTYVVQLIVNDGILNSTPATVTITSGDVAPVANPGPAQSANIGTIVNLTGSASIDSDNQPLTYQWSLLSKPANSTATLSQPLSETPYFTPDESGNYVVQLIVNDGFLSSTPVTVVVSTIYIPPVANPGSNQTVTAGATVQLSGAASTETNGNPLTYNWAILSQPTGGTAVLSSATVLSPTFVANMAGVYVVQLIVNDGTSNSQPVTVTITANPLPPVVNAGPNQTITLPVNSVTLNGSATDNGAPLTITWSVVSGPGAVSFSSPNTAVTNATFSSAGTYVLQLTANNSLTSVSATTTITVNPAANQPPVVSAGPNQTITLPTNSVTLTGTATDNGVPLTLAWSVVSGPGAVTFSSPNSLVTQATFSSTVGTYVLQLSASNPQYTSTAQVTITVNGATIQPPVVSAGPSQTITLPANTAILNGSASDNGAPMTIVWSEISGPTVVTFSSPATAVTQVSFTAPGAYVLQLSASNTQYTSASQTTVYVYAAGSNGKNQAPYVNAGPDQTIVLPAPVQLNGVALDDGLPNGTLAISWTVVSGPGTVAFSNQTAAVTTATFSMAGTYVLQLSADDSVLLSTSNVTITVGELYGHGGYKGTDFWLMFPQNYDNCPNCNSNSVYQFQPQLLISSDVNNSGTVTIPGLNFSANFTLSAGQATSVQIPTNAAMSGMEQVGNTGIRVTSQSEVTVVGFSYYTASSDGYLGLPTPVLGTNYIVMSWTDPYGSGLAGSEFGIVAPYDGTTVTITPTVNVGGRVAGQPYTVVLNQGRTYQLQTNAVGADLTGSTIASDKPIAVFSGMQLGFVPALAGITYCCGNHLIEEMLSTDLWGQNFYTVPIAGHVKGDYFRILAAQNNTNISLNGSPVATIDQGEFYQTVLTSPSSITADAPVMVAQFETSHWVEDPNLFDDSFYGDPSMFTVPPYQQFGGHYTVLTPTTGFRANYANVVVPASAASGMTLDGAPISATFTPIPGSAYSGAQVSLTTGVHHFDGTAPFGLTMYGADSYDAYSYQGGLVFDAARSGTTITLTPATLTQQTGTMLCFTASLLDAFGNPPGGIGVGFTVTGVNPASQSVDTNVSGQAQYCYVGSNSGTDTVLATIGGVSQTGTVTWNANSPNRAPIVYAGSNSSITLPSAANLLGVVSDDGLPIGGNLTTTWTVVSGAGSVTFGNASQPVTTATFSTAGTYDLRLTANDSQLSSYGDVTITVNTAPQNQPPVVNPGPNLTIELPLSATLYGIVTDDGLPTTGKLAVQWTEVSGPANSAPVAFSNPTSAYTQATFVQPGSYVLSLTGDDSQLQTTATVTVTVIAQNQPPLVSCPGTGPSFTAQLPNNTINLTCIVTDDGLPQGATVTQQWTQASGPAAVTFATPNQAPTLATFPVAGNYTLYLTASDTQLTTVQQVSVTVSPANLPPVVNITNSFQTITLPTNSVTLNATVTDPTGGTITQLWSQNSGPAPATIGTPSQPNTQITFTAAGTYVFWLTATDAQLSTTAGAEIIVNPAPVAPTVYAGANQTISLPSNTLTLNGTISNPGVPAGATITTTWTEVSGPASINFSNPTGLTTQVTFTTAGTYDLRLSANNTGLTGASDVTITVYAAPQSQPPVVSAGPNFTTTVGVNSYVAGSATDPGGKPLTLNWSQLSGPAASTNYYPNNAVTYVSFPVAGVYVLQLSANDTQLTSTATVTITVLPPVNQPPVVSAGLYQTTTLPNNVVTVSGQASDDGLPSGILITSWSEVNGPAAVTFANPNQLSTQVTVPVAGTYQLRLTATDTQLTSYSDTYVTVNPADQAPLITLNPQSLTISLSNPTATLSANIIISAGSTPTYAWSVYGGAGPVTFSNPNSLTTQATFPVVGSYDVQLVVSDGQLSSTAVLYVNVTAPIPAPPVVALLTPQDGLQVTAPINVIGTVTTAGSNVGGPGSGWVMDYSLNTQDGASTQTWTVLASGSYYFPGANASLGTLDPTVLLNGTYTLRLTATDNYGQTSQTTEAFIVSKNAKPGDFMLSFTDLSVPVAGLPITITRTYDSRDHGFHDFGAAWSLGVANVRVEKNRVLGKNWTEYSTGGGFSNYCLQSISNSTVTITFPDGTQYLFQTVATPQCQQIVPMTAATIGFTELPGSPGTVGATLVPADGGQVLFDGSVPGNVNLVDYNAQLYDPTVFILTTRDGHTYTIDQTLGVTSMADANGNSLTISPSGIVSSTGKSISFTRDAQNRITQIADPDGNTLKYAYNAPAPYGNGLLNTFTDGAGNTTSFYYTSGSAGALLSTIVDPRGVQVAASQYDATGHLTQLTDANGKPTAFAINETGQTETVTDRLGNPTTYSYDADGNILSMADPLGNVTTYTYDANDDKLTETNPLGKTTTYTYDASSNRLSQTDPLGNKTGYTYNAAGQVLTVTDPLGRTTTNVYDSNNNLTSTTDANGKTTSSVYNSNGLPSSVTDAAGNITQFQYDGSGNLTQQTDALGNVSTYTYDANNNKLSQTVTRTVNGQLQSLTTSYAYDGNNRVTKTTYPDGSTTQTQYNSIGKQSVTIDQLNRQTSYAYDTLGRLTTTTYPDNTTESTTYDANNNRLTSTDRAGNTTTYTYDADNRLTKTTYSDNSFTQTKYDAAGRVSSTVDANGNSTSYGYDDAGRRITLTDSLNHVTTFAYDNSGNQVSVKDARQNTTQYQYDALNRQIAVVYPDQTTSGTAYDNLGRVISKTDQAGKVTGYGYDGLGRLTSVTQDAATGGLNLVTTYGYDQVGNRISQTDANLHTTTYQYDQLGRRIARTLPAGQSESYVYDAAGNLKSKTDFNGKTTTYAYDTSNRLLSKTPDPSFNANPITFTYFPNGLRQTMGDPSGATTYAYDNRNRLTSKVTPFGTLSYTYDAGGDLLTLKSSNSGGASDTYTYDQLNRLSTVTDAAGGTTYAYDAVGNLQNFSYPNGVTHAYSYDPLNRLTQVGAAKNSSSVSNYAYTLGAAGNRLTVAELSGRSVAYNYDSLYRLTSEAVSSDPANKNGTISFTYDAVGNRKTLSSTLPPAGGNVYTYDADDRLGSDQYDANGNTTSSFGVADAYDFENHLIQKGSVTVVYDGDGNRVSETVGGVTTNYLVDTQNPTGYAQVVDELQSGSVSRTYSYGLERVSETQSINSTLTTSFYGYDGHGSVRQLTDSTGTVTDTYDYDAFGNLINQTGSTPNNYLFADEQYDPALSLYYNRARYLNSTTGRFWTADTFEGSINTPASLHRYLFADADPIDLRDPSGKEVDAVEAAAVASITTTLNASEGNVGLVLINGTGSCSQSQTPAQCESTSAGLINLAVDSAIGIVFLAAVGIGSKLLGNASNTLELAFSQISASPTFNDEGSLFYGETIGSLSRKIASNEIPASSVPIKIVVNSGTALIVNTRSALALLRAGVPQSSWNIIDATAEEGAAIGDRLLKNGLGPEGTDVITITGLGQNASNLQ